jgi:hypothetical protein
MQATCYSGKYQRADIEILGEHGCAVSSIDLPDPCFQKDYFLLPDFTLVKINATSLNPLLMGHGFAEKANFLIHGSHYGYPLGRSG